MTQVPNLACLSYFYYYFFVVCFFLCVCMCGKVAKGLFIFCIQSLIVVLLFQNKWTNIRRCEQKILNKYNKFG